jgi:ABC transporter transmembrane region
MSAAVNVTREIASVSGTQSAGPVGMIRPGRTTVVHALRAILRTHRWPILSVYALSALENTVCIAQPFVLGLAIDKLLQRSSAGLVLFIAQQVGYLTIGMLRRAYDTRVFSRIHAEVVTQIVLLQRRREVGISRIAARSAFSREFVEFFERQVPIMLQMAFLIFGGLAILALYDPFLVLVCLALTIPAGLLNCSYAHKAFTLSEQLHDSLEREVEVIGCGESSVIHDHYAAIARLQIGLSDSEVKNFGSMELFALALFAVALVRSCNSAVTAPGEVVALLRYITMFLVGLDGLPILIQQASRLCDIGRRCTFSE